MIVITLGDPLGVGIELVGRVLPKLPPSTGVTLVGSYFHWCQQLDRLKITRPSTDPIEHLADHRPQAYQFLSIENSEDHYPADKLSPLARGRLAVAALDRLRSIDLKRFCQSTFQACNTSSSIVPRLAVLTAPIDKHVCTLAGFAYPGQTEYFENLWQSQGVMTLVGPRLRTGLVTNHLPLSAVAAAITSDLVAAKLRSFIQTLQLHFGKPSPKVAVCALNPHGGDSGLFGNEDLDVVLPAIENVRQFYRSTPEGSYSDCQIVGPMPADTAFYQGYHEHFDGVLAMYHDQGLGPLKTVHFDEAINVSGGLPHLRVSPDHGPAKDLFLTGQASKVSMQTAFDLCVRYTSPTETSVSP